MATTERTVDNWSHFLDSIKPFTAEPGNLYGRIGFRGQEKSAQAWDLRPSLARLLPEYCDYGKAVEIERRLLREFSQDGHLHLRTLEVPNLNNPLGWVMIMQQYGAPTRLLDWTASPYVGAYFAVREAPREDGVLWVHEYVKLVTALRSSGTKMDLKRVGQALAGELHPPQDPPGICALFTLKRPERMYAQQGFYMLCEDPRRAHDEVMNEIAAKARVQPFVHKVIIRHKAKQEFLANLRMMNITGASLFPGADGLGRHVAEWGRLLAGGFATTPVEEAVADSAASGEAEDSPG